VTGHRHGHRPRTLLGTFGKVTVAMPRARLDTADGKTTEWKSRALRAYQRRTLAADVLIASCYLAGTNTRRVRRALASLFAGAVSKDTVSRARLDIAGDCAPRDSNLVYVGSGSQTEKNSARAYLFRVASNTGHAAALRRTAASGRCCRKRGLRASPNSDSADSKRHGLGGGDDGTAAGRSGESFL
jgi:hypothetical protein